MSLLASLSSIQRRIPCHIQRQRRGAGRQIKPAICSEAAVVGRNSVSFFSTNNSDGGNGKPPPPPLDRKQSRLPRTLYRQLLRWCQNTEAEMPLRPFIDPFSLAPPQIDEDKLFALKEFHDAQQQQQPDRTAIKTRSLIPTVHRLLPPRSDIHENHLVFEICNVAELRSLIRAMFRLNSQPPATEEIQKTRIAYAFQTLRTLNELAEALADLNRHRQDNANRGDDIEFFVGQVVQHKHERWRGVIAGWEKPSDEGNTDKDTDSEEASTNTLIELTSLTTKIYTAGDFLKCIRYEVILDLADMHTMQATAPLIVSTQDDLELVTDASLCRIRSSMVSQNFKAFDPLSNTFIANELLAYEYPVDRDMQQQASSATKKEDAQDAAVAVDAAAKETISNIKSFMAYLEQIIVLPDGHEQREELGLLRSVRQKFATPGHLGQHSVGDEEDAPPVASASSHLRHVYNLIMELRDILWHRKTFQELTSTPKFGLGDVVYHQFFGFRGVVVACDHVPKANVTHWDGVRHIDNVLQKPFYRVLPDERDCEEAFGGPRGMRYVCEDNLVACRGDRTAISVALDSLDPGWTRELDSQGKTVFVPSPSDLFKHGADIGDDGLTDELLKKIHDELRLWQVATRDLMDVAKQEGVAGTEDATSFRLSLPSLFLLLEAVTTLDGAESIELLIKDTFKSHANEDLQRQLEMGLMEMIRGKHDEALEMFKSLVDQDSQYAEAWNWVATCEYLMGRHSSSLEAAVKALELQPLNFQTQSGIGLCLYDMGKYEESAAAFRQCLDLDPWSPVSTKLAACIDVLNQRKNEVPEDEKAGKE